MKRRLLEPSIVYSARCQASFRIFPDAWLGRARNIRIVARRIIRIEGSRLVSAGLYQLSYAGISLGKYSLMRLSRVSFYTHFLYGSPKNRQITANRSQSE